MKLKYTFSFLELDDEITAVPVGTNSEEFTGILRINETAANIIKLLQKNKEEQEIIQEMMEEYDVPEKELSDYVHQFIEQLINAGLME